MSYRYFEASEDGEMSDDDANTARKGYGAVLRQMKARYFGMRVANKKRSTAEAAATADASKGQVVDAKNHTADGEAVEGDAVEGEAAAGNKDEGKPAAAVGGAKGGVACRRDQCRCYATAVPPGRSRWLVCRFFLECCNVGS